MTCASTGKDSLAALRSDMRLPGIRRSRLTYRADSARAMTHYLQWIPKFSAPTSNSQKWSTRRNYKLQFRNYVKPKAENTLKLLKNMVSTQVRFIVGSQAKPSLFMNFTPPH